MTSGNDESGERGSPMTAGSVLRFVLIVFLIAIAIGMTVRLVHGVRQRWRDRGGRGDGGGRG